MTEAALNAFVVFDFIAFKKLGHQVNQVRSWPGALSEAGNVDVDVQVVFLASDGLTTMKFADLALD